MATHFITLDRRNPWTEEPGGLSTWGHKVSDMTEWHIIMKNVIN